MNVDNISTEQCIKDAAQKIFLKKGFDGTTTRDIAEECGINRALVNYYFRSKEKLFNTIFLEKVELYFTGNLNILNKPISIKEKINELINYDFKVHLENPDLSIFINNEIHRDFTRLDGIRQEKIREFLDLFTTQLEEAIAKGEIRPINPKHLLAMISASIKFHFASKPLLMYLHKLTESEFTTFITEQKNLSIDLINNYLETPKQ